MSIDKLIQNLKVSIVSDVSTEVPKSFTWHKIRIRMNIILFNHVNIKIVNGVTHNEASFNPYRKPGSYFPPLSFSFSVLLSSNTILSWSFAYRL